MEAPKFLWDNLPRFSCIFFRARKLKLKSAPSEMYKARRYLSTYKHMLMYNFFMNLPDALIM